MALENKWVGYLDRSYEQIKAGLLARLTISNPEITDHSESNILVVIISMFAGITEMLNLYIDNIGRESFLQTARRYSSVVRLVKLLDYRIQAASAASADLLITFNNPLPSPVAIPQGTEFSTGNGITFITVQTYNLPINTTNASIGVSQLTPIPPTSIGTTDGSPSQSFPLGTDYVDDSATITINAIIWARVNSLGLSKPTDKHFIVDIDVDGVAYVKFGDNINGAIPPPLYPVMTTWNTTLGVEGNVDANTINTVGTLSLPIGITATCINLQKASGGAPYETIERIRTSAPLSIRTLDRAVTEQDYIDITKLAPGVGKAAILFNCGKKIFIYIVPVGGGIAAAPLLNSTYNYLYTRKIVGTFPEVKPAGTTELKITMDVTAKFRAETISTQTDIVNALVAYGSYDNQEINRSVKISDIIALVDNLAKVESLELVELVTMPYASPDGHINPLLWSRVVKVTSTVKHKWRLEYTIPGFRVIKDNLYIMTLPINTLYSDDDVEFTILPSLYSTTEKWEFTSYPANKSIIIDDYTLPSVQAGNLTINVVSQLNPPI